MTKQGTRKGAQKGRVAKEVPRILWISDAVAHTGFATVAHAVIDRLYTKYDFHVLGINYFGDPHKYKYPIYPAATGGDLWGMNRLPNLIRAIRPHIVMMLNDPWIVKDYIELLIKTPVGKLEDGTEVYPHAVAYMPVDGLNLQEDFVKPLNNLHLAIGYTEFALEQMALGGLTTKTAIIPHGMDATHFQPVPKAVARGKLQDMPKDWFIVGCANRNQPRKRIDLAMQYFAEFAKDKPENVRFYYHGAIQDLGWNIIQMSKYYGINDRLVITSPDLTPAHGVPREFLKNIYSAFDVHMSTSMGEGWGLTQMESMACAVPNIVPEWSGLGEWARGGVTYVPCTGESVHTGGLNTVGGIADKALFVEALNKMYYDQEYRDEIGKAGYELVSQKKFQWDSVATQFDRAFQSVLFQREL